MHNVDLMPKIFKMYRRTHDLTFKELAEKLGTSSGYLCELEYGKKKPSIDFLITYCKFFKVSLTVFLAISEFKFDNRQNLIGIPAKDMVIHKLARDLKK